ncbi:MAG: cation transporter [Actinobacteria bacterium]|nr:cation transporter [Actinomycetota bacterium]
MSTTEIKVLGMTCDHCVNSVTEELTAIASVTGVDVVLESGKVTIQSDSELSHEDVVAAIEEAGYEVIGA